MTGHSIMHKAARYTPDGIYIATASQDGTAKIWEATSGEEVFSLNANSGPINDAAFSPECVEPPEAPVEWCGPRLATAYRDGTVKIWDVTPRGNSELVILPGFDGQTATPGLIYTSLIAGSEMVGQTWDTSSHPAGKLLSKISFAGFPAPVATGCLSRDHADMPKLEGLTNWISAKQYLKRELEKLAIHNNIAEKINGYNEAQVMPTRDFWNYINLSKLLPANHEYNEVYKLYLKYKNVGDNKVIETANTLKLLGGTISNVDVGLKARATKFVEKYKFLTLINRFDIVQFSAGHDSILTNTILSIDK